MAPIVPDTEPPGSEEHDRSCSTTKERVPKLKSEEPDEDDEGKDQRLIGTDNDRYLVEKILAEKVDEAGDIKYLVKWIGYDEPTWEPQKHLAFTVALQTWDHKEKRPVERLKKGRRKTGNEGRVSKGAKNKKELKFPRGSWESFVDCVLIFRETKAEVDRKDSACYGVLKWQDQERTLHKLGELRGKCPRKLLDYYETRL